MSRRNLIAALALCLLAVPVVALSKAPPEQGGAAAPSATSPEAQAALEDIQKTLGFVPTFFKAFPDEAVAGTWEEMKSLELAETAIPKKYKQLITLAVAAQVPCRYCVYYGQATARLEGANDRELRESVAMAAIVRHWSTVLNGMQIDEATFRSELNRTLAFMKKAQSARPGATTPAPVKVTDAASAYKDMEQTLGLVPTFLKAYPPAGIAGAWRQLKGVQLNPATAIPGKYKELIGLAVAAQIPCQYCTTFHTEVARSMGASDAEIAEAVAMAALTYKWSTVLNGMQIDEATFRQETDRLITNARRTKTAPPPSPTPQPTRR